MPLVVFLRKHGEKREGKGSCPVAQIQRCLVWNRRSLFSYPCYTLAGVDKMPQLDLAGYSIAENSGTSGSQALLMEMMELREEIDSIAQLGLESARNDAAVELEANIQVWASMHIYICKRKREKKLARSRLFCGGRKPIKWLAMASVVRAGKNRFADRANITGFCSCQVWLCKIPDSRAHIPAEVVGRGARPLQHLEKFIHGTQSLGLFFP